jgi:uncharacterized protein with ParB-like and HNH nuclease domain
MSKNKNIIAAKTYLISKEFGDQLPLFKHYLTIPTYQRPYSWKKENILTLMNDYVFDMTKEYFIGNITLINDNEKLPQRLEIVDGQQRIATNYLILIWLKNHFKDVQKFFSFNSKVSEIKLEMSYPDDEILTKICEKDTNRKIFSEFDSYLNRKPNKYVRKQIKIFKNAFVTIQNFLEKRSDLQEIYEFIFNNVFCLEIIDNHDGIVGDLLFLSLNGKGLKLDQIDLIKSFFVRDYMDTSTDLKSFKDK